MKLGWLVIGLLLLAGLVGGAGYLGFRSNRVEPVTTPQAPSTVPVTTCDVEQSVTAPGAVVNIGEVTLEMPTAGRLVEVLVRPGDAVKAGQVLARLGDKEKFAAALTAARLELLKAEKVLADLKQQAPAKAAEAQVALADAQKALEEAQRKRANLDYPRASQATISEAQAFLDLTEEQLKRAQSEYDSLTNLPASDPQRMQALQTLSNTQRERVKALATLNWYLGNPSETEVAQAEAQLTLAKAQLAQAQDDWERLKDGPDALEVTLAQASIEDAQASLAAADNRLAHLELAAPIDGVVLEVKVKVGESIPEGNGVMVINDPKNVEVEFTVIEEDLPYVNIGQPVELYFDALSSETITGTVSRIVPKRAPGDRPLYYVYLGLSRVPDKLVAGMSADASVVIAQRKGVLCLPRALVKAAANGAAVVEVWSNWQKQKRTVQVGLRGDTNVEILSGLKAGELVVSK